MWTDMTTRVEIDHLVPCIQDRMLLAIQYAEGCPRDVV